MSFKRLTSAEFLSKATNGNGDWSNGQDWLPFDSGTANFALDDKGEVICGEVTRGVAPNQIVLGAVILDMIPDDSTAPIKGREVPFNMSMLPVIKNAKLAKMTLPFVVEQRTSRAGSKYQQPIFDTSEA